MKLMSSREFNQDVSRAKREALVQPVLVTDRGQPTHVLMSMAEFHRLTGQQASIVDLLAVPDAPPLDAGDAADGPWDPRGRP